MFEEITLDELTQNSVSIKIQKYYTDGTTTFSFGEPHRISYVNSVNGRIDVEQSVPEPHRTAIFTIWRYTNDNGKRSCLINVRKIKRTKCRLFYFNFLT